MIEELNQLITLAGDVGWIPVLFFVLYKTGMIQVPFLKNGDAKQQDVDNKTGEFQGYVKAKLESVDEKMDTFGDRLSRHLDAEELQRKEDLSMIDKRLSIIESDIKNLSKQ